MRRSGDSGGFSLLEMVVVLSIVLIMTAAVVPMYQGSITWAQRDRAVRDVVARMKYAQERAISDIAEYRFYLNHETGAYWLMRRITEPDADADDETDSFEEVDDAGATRARLPESASFARPKALLDKKRDAHYIAFYPGGSCDYATITIEYDKRSETKISTKGRLGQLEVERG